MISCTSLLRLVLQCGEASVWRASKRGEKGERNGVGGRGMWNTRAKGTSGLGGTVGNGVVEVWSGF